MEDHKVLNVCLVGVTGWAGSELARAIAHATDLTLVAGVARQHAGNVIGDVLGEPRLTGRIYPSAREALANPYDVFVEYTKPDSARTNVMTALERQRLEDEQIGRAAKGVGRRSQSPVHFRKVEPLL